MAKWHFKDCHRDGIPYNVYSNSVVNSITKFSSLGVLKNNLCHIKVRSFIKSFAIVWGFLDLAIFDDFSQHLVVRMYLS